MTFGSSNALQPGVRPATATEASISTLTYRSQATTPLTAEALEALVGQARERNRALGVTGMLLFAEDQFYQWLEGPPESVAQVWDSIQADTRHTSVELLVRHHQSRPLFSDWDMKFLRRSPATAAPVQPRLPPALVRLVADLALRGDGVGIADGLQELMLMGQDFTALQAGLVEEAARLLGDWWMDDLIRASEITLALGHLQGSLRRISAPERRVSRPRNGDRQILMAPLPGEPHRLGVALVGDAFRRVGWLVTSEYPANVEALAGCLQAKRYDALTLCLSDVLEGSDQIAPLTEAIRIARWASSNPALIILAGGRLFQRQPHLAALIGANAVYLGASEAQSKMTDEIEQAALSEQTADRSVAALH